LAPKEIRRSQKNSQTIFQKASMRSAAELSQTFYFSPNSRISLNALELPERQNGVSDLQVTEELLGRRLRRLLYRPQRPRQESGHRIPTGADKDKYTISRNVSSFMR
jgi:hypothetical protein